MKKIPLFKLIILFYKLPADVRGLLYASMVSGIQWEKIQNDKKGDKASKNITS